jgi:hypothetical protein
MERRFFDSHLHLFCNVLLVASLLRDLEREEDAAIVGHIFLVVDDPGLAVEDDGFRLVAVEEDLDVLDKHLVLVVMRMAPTVPNEAGKSKLASNMKKSSSLLLW